MRPLPSQRTAEARPILINDSRFGSFGEGSRIFDVAYRDDATGEVITMNDFYNRYGDVLFPDGEQGPPGFTQVAIGIPGDQYLPWVLRESAVLGALALASGASAVALVQRRRPS